MSLWFTFPPPNLSFPLNENSRKIDKRTFTKNRTPIMQPFLLSNLVSITVNFVQEHNFRMEIIELEQKPLEVNCTVYTVHSWAPCLLSPLSPVIRKKKILTDLTSLTFSQI